MGQEFDDNGLPPLEVDIPDDASELDRDAQAYRREVRWRRRRELLGKLLRTSGRYGSVAPLILSILLIVAISAVVLVVTAHPSGQAPRWEQPGPQSAVPGEIGGPLPDARVVVNGTARSLRRIHPAVLVLASEPCRCGPAVDELAARARSYGIPVYLVESGRGAERSWPERQPDGQPPIAEEPAGALRRTYEVSGLTAVLVDPDGGVATVLDDASTKTDWRTHLAPLRGSWD